MATRTHTNASATTDKPANNKHENMAETVARANKQKEARALVARELERALETIRATSDASEEIITRLASNVPDDTPRFYVRWSTKNASVGKLTPNRCAFVVTCANRSQAIELTRALVVRAHKWAAGCIDAQAAAYVAENWAIEQISKQTFAKSAPTNKQRKPRTNNSGSTTAAQLTKLGFDMSVRTSKLSVVA